MLDAELIRLGTCTGITASVVCSGISQIRSVPLAIPTFNAGRQCTRAEMSPLHVLHIHAEHARRIPWPGLVQTRHAVIPVPAYTPCGAKLKGRVNLKRSLSAELEISLLFWASIPNPALNRQRSSESYQLLSSGEPALRFRLEVMQFPQSSAVIQ